MTADTKNFIDKIDAWKDVGVSLDGVMTSYEAIQNGKLDFNVIQVDIDALIPDSSFGIKNKRIKDHFANVREDNDEILAVVGGRYSICQHQEGFNFLDGLAQDHQIIGYEAAICLQGGRKAMLICRVPGEEEIRNNDTIIKTIMFVNSHDGSSKINIIPVAVRTRTMTTFRIGSRRNLLGIRHSGDIKQKLRRAKEIMKIVMSQFDIHIATAQKLTKHKINPDQWKEFLDDLLPIITKGSKITQIRMLNARHTVQSYYIYDTKANAEGLSNTLWSAFNAIVQYVDHSKPLSRRSNETKFNQTTFGAGDKLKEQAWNNAVQIMQPSNAVLTTI